MSLVADEPHGLKWDTKVLLLKIHCQYGVNPLLFNAPASRCPVKTLANNNRAASECPELPSVQEGKLMMQARYLADSLSSRTHSLNETVPCICSKFVCYLPPLFGRLDGP
jgi:hypothetical protein